MIQEPIKQRTFIKATPEQVYDTITSGAGWNAFFTHATEVDPKPGGDIIFRWKDWGPDFYTTEDHGTVVEADRPKTFAFKWGTHRSTVRFELTPQFGGTVVELTEVGYPDTPEGRTMMLECACGWAEAVTLLKFYLEHGLVYTPPER